MSANRDILDAFIAASMRKDYETFLDLMTDDIEYSWSMSARPVIGKTVMRKFLKNYTNALDQLEWNLNNVIEQGDLMMVEGVEKVFDRNRQVEIDNPFMQTIEFRDGKICKLRDYYDSAKLQAETPATAVSAG